MAEFGEIVDGNGESLHLIAHVVNRNGNGGGHFGIVPLGRQSPIIAIGVEINLPAFLAWFGVQGIGACGQGSFPDGNRVAEGNSGIGIGPGPPDFIEGYQVSKNSTPLHGGP